MTDMDDIIIDLKQLPPKITIEVDALIHFIVNHSGPQEFITTIMESILSGNTPPEVESINSALESLLVAYNATESPEFLRGVIAGALEVLVGMDPSYTSIGVERLIKAGIDPITGRTLTT